MSYDADLIIAGAGCAGLSALWHAVHSSAHRQRIIVIDRDFEVGDDRTWAFWGTAHAPFARFADRSWDQLEVRFPGRQSSGTLRPSPAGLRRSYWRVRQRDYDRAVLAETLGRTNIRFVAQDISCIRDDHDGGVVELPEGELRAPVVLQSTRLSPGNAGATVRHPLRQHFGGWEVRTERPVFDRRTVTLMDFDTAQFDGAAFFYVLPDRPDRALVEHTMFSLRTRTADFHDAQIRRRLQQLGAGEVSIERTEYGTIPMEDRRLDQRWGDHVWNLGSVGGMTKPTSGYTFQRIHAQSRHLVDRWASGAPLTPLPTAPPRYRFADRTLLNILHHQPERGRPIFERLFRTTEIDQVLTFLDEQSTPMADARLVRRLPWRPFLRAGASELGAELVDAGRRFTWR